MSGLLDIMGVILTNLMLSAIGPGSKEVVTVVHIINRAYEIQKADLLFKTYIYPTYNWFLNEIST